MPPVCHALLGIVLLLSQFQDRATEPDAAAQKDTLKQIKDLFKDDYAKKGSVDQSSLAQKLLQKGIETNDNLPSKFVFLKEARDIAAGAGDAETALRAATGLGEAFTVDSSA